MARACDRTVFGSALSTSENESPVLNILPTFSHRLCHRGGDIQKAIYWQSERKPWDPPTQFTRCLLTMCNCVWVSVDPCVCAR